jgi:hypothetical protein
MTTPSGSRIRGVTSPLTVSITLVVLAATLACEKKRSPFVKLGRDSTSPGIVDSRLALAPSTVTPGRSRATLGNSKKTHAPILGIDLNSDPELSLPERKVQAGLATRRRSEMRHRRRIPIQRRDHRPWLSSTARIGEGAWSPASKGRP